jgi:hypothetical protein
MSQVYQSRHSLAPGCRKARRVTSSAGRSRADISHAGISSLRVAAIGFQDHGRTAVVAALGGLAVLDGTLLILIGLR